MVSIKRRASEDWSKLTKNVDSCALLTRSVRARFGKVARTRVAMTAKAKVARLLIAVVIGLAIVPLQRLLHVIMAHRPQKGQTLTSTLQFARIHNS
jgi:hypothetical protein